jgi:recombination protein RecA
MVSDKKDKYLAFFEAFAEGEEAMKDVSRAHETIGEKIPVISTGSYVLDNALSSGGLPKGRLIQYYGAPGSGKTLLSMIAIVEAQAEDPKSHQVFIDAEQTFSETWARQVGVDTSRLILVQGDMAVNGRRCFEMLLGVPKEDAKTHILKGKSKEGLLDKIAIGELNVNLIVLDSLGSIIPPGEDISVVGKMNMALLSRFLTTTFRKLSLELSKANVPFIIVNHKKSSMDMYTDHTFSGGNTYAHFLSANVYFEPINAKDAKILDDKEQKVGQAIRATIEKSKFGPWPRKCEFKVNFGSGVIDKHEEIAQLALDYNVVQKPTSVSHVYEEQKWVGFPKFCEAIMENTSLASELLVKIAEAREAKTESSRSAQKALSERLFSDQSLSEDSDKKAKKTSNKE